MDNVLLPIRILAASPDSGSGRALLWIGILIVITLLGGLILVAVRRRMFSSNNDDDDSASLMDQLRAMRDRNQINQEEFEAARRSLREKMAKIMEANSRKKPKSRPSGPDKNSQA
jgi:hypothetical protein